MVRSYGFLERPWWVKPRGKVDGAAKAAKLVSVEPFQGSDLGLEERVGLAEFSSSGSGFSSSNSGDGSERGYATPAAYSGSAAGNGGGFLSGVLPRGLKLGLAASAASATLFLLSLACSSSTSGRAAPVFTPAPTVPV
ncbi:MAG: hypothetical protein AABX60_00595, partial [Nanoarchaeota archaeon]